MPLAQSVGSGKNCVPLCGCHRCWYIQQWRWLMWMSCSFTPFGVFCCALAPDSIDCEWMRWARKPNVNGFHVCVKSSWITLNMYEAKMAKTFRHIYMMRNCSNRTLSGAKEKRKSCMTLLLSVEGKIALSGRAVKNGIAKHLSRVKIILLPRTNQTFISGERCSKKQQKKFFYQTNFRRKFVLLVVFSISCALVVGFSLVDFDPFWIGFASVISRNRLVVIRYINSTMQNWLEKETEKRMKKSSNVLVRFRCLTLGELPIEYACGLQPNCNSLNSNFRIPFFFSFAAQTICWFFESDSGFLLAARLSCDINWER